MFKRELVFVTGLLLCCTTLAEGTRSPIEEIIVIAQKKAQPMQEVPIAVTALDEQALNLRQIELFSDLQLHVPNVSYSKNNFARSNFQIRGVGSLLDTPTVDYGVAIHVNDVFLNVPRMAETVYYDLAQIEVLRGPQGTLYGRNATGGVVNVRTRRPEIGQFDYSLSAQLGNYDHQQLEGAVNLPMGERVSARFAGVWLERDGYTDNIITGRDIDNREQWSLRTSVRFDLSEKTRIDFVAHRFEESSTRTRSQKTLCQYDPSAVLGCLPDALLTQPTNSFASSGKLFSSNLILGQLGLFDFYSQALDESLNPDDYREVRSTFEPEYETDEDFAMVELVHDFETLTLTALASYQETSFYSRQDLNGTSGELSSVVAPDFFCFFSPAACRQFDVVPGGPLFVSDPTSSSSFGAIGGDFLPNDRESALDVSEFNAQQYAAEVRLASEFEGPVNFQLGASYFDFDSDGYYQLAGTTLDYPALVFANAPLAGNPSLYSSLAPAHFTAAIDDYTIESLSAFAELYFALNDTMQVTLGLRYTEDDKAAEAHQYFFNLPVVVNVETETVVLQGQPVADLNELFSTAAELGLYDADPSRPGNQPTYSNDHRFSDWSGRLVFDWQPEFKQTDHTLVYFSYSRGFKSGGFNSPAARVSLNGKDTFDSETLDAYEIGTKNLFADNRVMLNANVFHYDYDDVHIATAGFNENIDASIDGVELELVWAPTENWLFNLQWSYLDSSVEDYRAIDPANPTAGRQDVTLIKDFQQANHCVIEHNGLPAPTMNPAFISALQATGVPYLPTGQNLGGFGGPPGVTLDRTPGVSESAFSLCAAMEGFAPFFGYNYSPGIEQNLDGNSLTQAPEKTLGVGGAYTWYLSSGKTIVARLDYYWQDEFNATVFDRPRDRVDSWDIYNARIELRSADEKWAVTAFIKNIEDDDDITGAFTAANTSGLYTNAFLLEPRLYGLTVNWRR